MSEKPRKHWLGKLLANSDKAAALAKQIEDADVQVAALKQQLEAVIRDRAELESAARDLASERTTEAKIAEATADFEAELLGDCNATANILREEKRRLLVTANPFLAELAQVELAKTGEISQKMNYWRFLAGRN